MCLEMCCYGIDLGASIVRFHQSEHSIWTVEISTNESAPLCSAISHLAARSDAGYQGKVFIFVLLHRSCPVVVGDALRGIVLVDVHLILVILVIIILIGLILVQPIPVLVNL